MALIPRILPQQDGTEFFTPLSDGLGSTQAQAADFTKPIVPKLTTERFVSSKALQLAMGPALYDDAKDKIGSLSLLGMVQDFNMQQNRSIREVFELGSRAIYYIIDRTSRQLSLSRMMFYGPTILRAMYEGWNNSFPAETGLEAKYKPGLDENALAFLNLDSLFFEQPSGIYMQFGTMGQRTSAAQTQAGGAASQRINPIGAVYLEECLIRGHVTSSSANQGMMAENVVLTFGAVVPVAPLNDN